MAVRTPLVWRSSRSARAGSKAMNCCWWGQQQDTFKCMLHSFTLQSHSPFWQTEAIKSICSLWTLTSHQTPLIKTDIFLSEHELLVCLCWLVGLLLRDFDDYRRLVHASWIYTKTKNNWGSGRPAFPVFCEVKLLYLSKESCGFSRVFEVIKKDVCRQGRALENMFSCELHTDCGKVPHSLAWKNPELSLLVKKHQRTFIYFLKSIGNVLLPNIKST